MLIASGDLGSAIYSTRAYYRIGWPIDSYVPHVLLSRGTTDGGAAEAPFAIIARSLAMRI